MTESLGDCSFLNTCFHVETCKFVHYKVDDADRRSWLPTKLDASKPEGGVKKKIQEGSTTLFPPQVRPHSHTSIRCCYIQFSAWHRCQPSRNRAGNPAFCLRFRIFVRTSHVIWFYFETNNSLRIVIIFHATKTF